MKLNPFDIGYYEDFELKSFGFKSIGSNVKIAKIRVWETTSSWAEYDE